MYWLLEEGGLCVWSPHHPKILQTHCLSISLHQQAHSLYKTHHRHSFIGKVMVQFP